MFIKPKRIKGVFEIQLGPKRDKRGYFMRSYDNQIFKQYGLHRRWVQENQSLSKKKGTVRGFHFQFPPYSETKLVRVVRGKILDVYLDLRKDSATFGQWESVILSAANKKMLYLPRGLAHGFCTLSDNCLVLYKMDNYYTLAHEGAIAWNDPDLGINWSFEGKPIISGKDAKAKSFREFIETYGGLKV